MKYNTGFLKKWGQRVSQRICEIHGIDPEDTEARALLGYNIENGDAQIQRTAKISELYHGSDQEMLKPVLEHGNYRHDFGQGFYLTNSLELAREWAVSYNNATGYVHGYLLNTTRLNILDLREYPFQHWMAEIISHRNNKSMSRYFHNLQLFIEKYKLDTTDVDVIIGYRADSSHFNIIKAYMQNQLDATLIPKALQKCEAGVQYCLKSPEAFESLAASQVMERIDSVFSQVYHTRDLNVRIHLDKLINSKFNTLEQTYSSLMEVSNAEV